mmetsp:Transcript_2927/g.7015  ORF Transcript_2927/g.7015 Transcript_2927/m.7015 type:complete len:225 (+) Transcript_2927:2187-2861(+)
MSPFVLFWETTMSRELPELPVGVLFKSTSSSPPSSLCSTLPWPDLSDFLRTTTGDRGGRETFRGSGVPAAELPSLRLNDEPLAERCRDPDRPIVLVQRSPPKDGLSSTTMGENPDAPVPLEFTEVMVSMPKSPDMSIRSIASTDCMLDSRINILRSDIECLDRLSEGRRLLMRARSIISLRLVDKLKPVWMTSLTPKRRSTEWRCIAHTKRPRKEEERKTIEVL